MASAETWRRTLRLYGSNEAYCTKGAAINAHAEIFIMSLTFVKVSSFVLNRIERDN